MKIKTSELTGQALDWAVAKCENQRVEVTSRVDIIQRWKVSLTEEEISLLNPPKPYVTIPGVGQSAYSTSWEQGGPLIDRELITVRPVVNPVGWMAINKKDGRVYEGQTALIAVCRCYVASKLGDTVDIPEDLL